MKVLEVAVFGVRQRGRIGMFLALPDIEGGGEIRQLVEVVRQIEPIGYGKATMRVAILGCRRAARDSFRCGGARRRPKASRLAESHVRFVEKSVEDKPVLGASAIGIGVGKVGHARAMAEFCLKGRRGYHAGSL